MYFCTPHLKDKNNHSRLSNPSLSGCNHCMKNNLFNIGQSSHSFEIVNAFPNGHVTQSRVRSHVLHVLWHSGNQFTDTWMIRRQYIAIYAICALYGCACSTIVIQSDALQAFIPLQYSTRCTSAAYINIITIITKWYYTHSAAKIWSRNGIWFCPIRTWKALLLLALCAEFDAFFTTVIVYIRALSTINTLKGNIIVL